MSYIFKPRAGNKLIRVIGNQFLEKLDPFLVLDHFKLRLPVGFPDHPHRGFQTITYMKTGKFHHEDFKGNRGTIGPGDFQWMTAGKGIVHAQMSGSAQEDSTGFQLWLNLKKKDKMQEPNYKPFTADKFSIVQKNGNKVKLIVGEWEGHTGPIKYEMPACYMDLTIPKNGVFEMTVKKSWNTIIYPYQGSLEYSAEKVTHQVDQNVCCVLQKSNEKDITHTIKSKGGANFVWLSGEPINEPMERNGIFVMNSKEQIQQTYDDYKNAVNGFEDRINWESKIKQMSKGKKFEDL